MSIQWFPGHMNKARRAIKDLLPDIDIVIELLDARAPFASMNPLIQDLIKSKRKIRLLNKSDLADKKTTALWLEYFRSQSNTLAITGCMNDKAQRNQIISHCRRMVPERNSFEKPLRVMITGIPNVGKSTLINQLINKKSAKTGDIPAVTKANQCLTITDDFLVYDTPGMMWEKIEHPQTGFNLALCNSIGRNALDVELLAHYLLEYMPQHYPEQLITRYKLSDSNLLLKADDLLELIGKKRGAIMSGGIIDIEKTSNLIIQDFRNSKFGNVSLETPELWENWTKN
jgi:ribosome biogenesis GTPase A